MINLPSGSFDVFRILESLLINLDLLFVDKLEIFSSPTSSSRNEVVLRSIIVLEFESSSITSTVGVLSIFLFFLGGDASSFEFVLLLFLAFLIY